MATLLSPLLSTAREKSRRVSCQNNQRTLGISIQSYAGDNFGMLPPGSSDIERDRLFLFPGSIIGASYLPASRVNKHIFHQSYNALHNVNILRDPKVYKCPSRGTHDISDDSYNANLTNPWFRGDPSGVGTFGPDQSQMELSYVYSVNTNASDLSSNSSPIWRTFLNEKFYDSEISIVRDRVTNHGGYDYGNVLYGDGHVEAKQISGGRDNGSSVLRNDWLTYHIKNTIYTSVSGIAINTKVSGRYSSTANPYEGNMDGLGDAGTIRFFDSTLGAINVDDSSSFKGTPPHQP